MRIISPKCDFCMKELFENETIRKYFISDVLDLPIEEIKSVRLMNPFLWKRHQEQKQGILDVLVELNDHTKINIEIQRESLSYWDKRQVFYLAKLFTADLRVGENYRKAKRCVSISILDFNLTDGEEYHNVYLLRDAKGNIFSDIIELHTLELRKNLTGEGAVEEWMKFFSVEREEDLDMIKTMNEGIREAVRELRVMSLRKRLQMRYEAHLKMVRDRNARNDYLLNEGMQKGIEKGIEQGKEQGMEYGIKALVETCKELGLSEEETGDKIRAKFEVSEEGAEKFIMKYWK